MSLEELLENKREEIVKIAKKHGAYHVRVFGSVARGEAGPNSDIDFLIKVRSNTSSWFPGGLLMDLRDLLGVNVDVVTENGLKERIRESVLAEAVEL